jgi:MSHA biogenesis protein MshP
MRRQTGFALLTAIFILVVLAGLGAAIMTVSSNQQISSAIDVQGARAYLAARAGVDWALYMEEQYYLPIHQCPPSPSSFSPAASTMLGLVVTVTCVATPDLDPVTGLSRGGPTVYTVTSTACNQPTSSWSATTAACPNTTNPGALYVERQLVISF